MTVLKPYRTRTCADAPRARKGCHCEHCVVKRAAKLAVDRVRLREYQAEISASAKRAPQRFRCTCGWLQQIPEGETARCGRCGTVPLFARPEPDLRQFRNGR